MAQNMVPAQEFKWLAEMSFDANDFEDAGAGGRGELPDQLSIKDNVFTFRTSEGTTEAPNPRQLYIVYLGGKKPKSRALRLTPYDEDDPQPPVCQSQDGVNFESGSIPPVITDPTNPRCGQTTRNCRECPMAKWGSATSVKTGKAVPACKEHKEIAVKVLGVPGAWQFKLPPASFSNWDKATAKLKAAIDADKAAHNGKTTLSLGNAVFSASFSSGMGNILFEPMGYLAKIPEEMSQVVALRQEPEIIDKLLWGGTERRLQYEEGTGKRLDPAMRQQPALPPVEPPADLPLAAYNNLQNQQVPQNHIPEMAQAAAAALKEKQEPPKQETKKTTKPAQAVDMKALLAKMGLPEG